MLQLTLLLGREVIGVYDFTQPVIRVGRASDLDMVIDNPSVSRRQAEFRRERGSWIVEDMGSSNGTFLGGQRIDGVKPLRSGDEVGFGKYSILFDKAVAMSNSAPHRMSHAAVPGHDGTTHIRPDEVRELLDSSQRKQGSQLKWECGNGQGVHYFVDASAVLVGTDDLCDVKVPEGPRHHILVVSHEGHCQVRNLHGWARMHSGDGVTRIAEIGNGGHVKIGRLKLSFVSDIREG